MFFTTETLKYYIMIRVWFSASRSWILQYFFRSLLPVFLPSLQIPCRLIFTVVIVRRPRFRPRSVIDLSNGTTQSCDKYVLKIRTLSTIFQLWLGNSQENSAWCFWIDLKAKRLKKYAMCIENDNPRNRLKFTYSILGIPMYVKYDQPIWQNALIFQNRMHNATAPCHFP